MKLVLFVTLVINCDTNFGFGWERLLVLEVAAKMETITVVFGPGEGGYDRTAKTRAITGVQELREKECQRNKTRNRVPIVILATDVCLLGCVDCDKMDWRTCRQPDFYILVSAVFTEIQLANVFFTMAQYCCGHSEGERKQWDKSDHVLRILNDG